MWGLSLVLAAWLLTTSDSYFFEDGYSHHYTYWADNSMFGHQNVTTILKFQVSPVNQTESGNRLHSLTVDSLVQRVHNGIVVNNPKKWDLSKTFLFETDERGSVTLVHCHHEDHDELLFIKKAMVSVFSVNVQIKEDSDNWEYTADDFDHLGQLQHQYQVQRTDGGLKLQRKHYSEEDAYRFHEKTLHYDHQGTLHTAEAKDRILFKDRTNNPQQTVRLPGELPHKVTVSGDFPDIEASVTVRVNLDKKRPAQIPVQVFQNLTAQTLETKLKVEKHRLEDVERNISNIFECLRLLPDKDDVNRSVCVNELRNILRKLPSDEYSQVVNDTLGNRCDDNDTVCEDRRLIFIDVVARIGDMTSQKLLLHHVLSRQPPVNEELRRIFIHCAALENPIPEFIHGVEAFCFGIDGEHHGTRSMTRPQSRACLAVGSLTRHLSNGGQNHEANRLADRLETWLDDHGKGDSHVSKRDTWLTDTEDDDHHISKAILLHALGNAALPRSRRHLLLHAQPNRGHQVWRRAALDGLRHYNCTESANAMLDSLFHEEKYSVRKMALSLYTSHPRRKEVSREYENDILSRNYTYPMVARVKREMLEKVIFKFKLKLPTLDWKKNVGTSDVGASFGVYFENGIDILFKVLSGYVDVTVHDKAWAEAHIGLVGKSWDIFLIEVCYKGRLSYNMNIIKDFTVGLFQDISSAFDHIARQVVEPLENAANELATQYQDPNSNATKSGFDPLAQAVKRLPERTEHALKSTVDFSKVADTVGNLPVVTKIQQLAGRAQSLMEDIHGEATDLFANIGDVTSVVLPFAEKEIRSSINTVLGKLDKISEAPNKVLSFIERAQMGYTLAMKRILEGNKVIKQATSFLTGTRNTFMSAGRELNEVLQITKHLVNSLRVYHSRRKREANLFDDFEQSSGSGQDGVNDLYAKADEMVTELSNITSDSAKELQRGFDTQTLYTNILKSSYEAFKEAIDMIKSRITAMFGQKFHPKFPNQRRDCDDKCKCGYFPTDCTRYGHPGLDLKWESDWTIPNPVAGMMFVAGNNSVRIKGVIPDFKDYEIFLSNIRLTIALNETGTFVDAGQIIGTPLGNNGCEDSHFHLAMKRKPPGSSDGLCYYVDPSPFLDTMEPVPTWIEECKDFNFKHIGQVVDFRKLTDGFKKVLEELKRFALDVGKRLLVKAVSLLPDTGFLGTLKSIAGNIVENIDLDPANLKNLFNDGVNAAKDFIEDISSKNFNLNGILGMAHRVVSGLGNAQLSNSLSKITDFINKAKNMIRNPTPGNFKSLAAGSMGRVLSSRRITSVFPAGLSRLLGGLGGLGGLGAGLGAALGGLGLDGIDLGSLPSFGQGCASDSEIGSILESGLQTGLDELGSSLGQAGANVITRVTSSVTSFVSGRDGMMTALKASACQLCPSFGNALSAATKSMCVPHDDCLGIDCDVSFQNAFVSANIDVTLKVYPQERKVTITSNGNSHDVRDNGDQDVIAGIKLFRIFEVKFKVKTEWQESELRMTFSALACAIERCLAEVPIIKNIRFDGQSRRKRSLEEFLGPFLSDMQSLPIDGLTKMFSDFNFPMSDILDQVNGIQESIASELQTNEIGTEPIMEAEFQNPMDHKDNGSFPVPGENGELFLPFFVFVFGYPMGPCFFLIDFSAGGAFGVSFTVKAKALDSLMQTEIKPWVSGKIEAGLTLSIVVAKAGIRLTGYLMKVGFPLTLTTNYTKQPVETTKSLDVELIPLELILKAWVELLWGLFSWDTVLWHWTADPIRTTVWKNIESKDDLGPPRFPYCDRVTDQCNGRRRRQIRAAEPTCSVIQLSGRHPNDAAFKLEFAVEDEDSDLKLWYAVGDYPGGTNVVDWTEMRGTSLLVPAVLPCGIPLHFLVRARNTQGLETTARCSLPNYDCTFPDGRVDAAFKCSSHSHKISATVVLFEDSQLQYDNIFHAVGYSPSSFGHEVVDWLPLSVSNGQTQQGASGDLRYFSSPRPGRLANTPKRSLKAPTLNNCASECIKLTTCVSFSYNQYVQDCELQEVSESPNVERTSDGFFQTYERLGRAYTASLKYENLPLRHGTKYYVNADINNVLGYRVTLTSQGTMIDFTPPEPGNVGEVMLDEIKAGGCNVSIMQRCVDAIPSTANHRKIIDGPGSRTVLNGNRRGQDMVFTIENYQASANWDGFKDEECGIHGYTWAVGTAVCGTDVASYTDPHATILNPNDWTYTGLAKNLHLTDGKYYVTVQAVSDIEHGGDLVTTVCHSSPFVVDTTPPSLHSVDEILFDETFSYLVVYYNASDVVSGIASMEFGLGKTKYDAMIRPYLPFEMRGQGGNTYLVNEEFETDSGVPAWIRLKVVNSVGLSVTGSSDAPILLDSSAPLPGHVMDGSRLGQDICCQKNVTHLCAQWMDFYDPESNIESYEWGIGLTPRMDDVVPFQNFTSYTKQSCVKVTLEHNTTYYSTVVAYNKALNQKSVNVSSDGVLIDITPPVPGVVVDGSDIIGDMNYTSETATITATWDNFYDPESGLDPYSLSVFINSGLQRTFSSIEAETFTDHSFSFHHGDTVFVEIQARNRAGGEVVIPSDGMLVDHTPPELVYIRTLNNTLYQYRDNILELVWDFQDHESGIAEYRCVIFETIRGRKNKFWPTLTNFHTIIVNMTSDTSEEDLHLDGIRLQNGAMYALQVTAINRAKMATSEESKGVIIDTTPPVVLQVSLARPGEEEELNENNEIEHVDREPLTVTWLPQDSDSGVKESYICIALATGTCTTSMSKTVDGSLPFTTVFEDLSLQVSTDENKYVYQAFIVVVNGAGVSSNVVTSKPFIVLKANVAGTVIDGRLEDDIDFSHDKTSVAMSFSGFSSEACGIDGYEWGIGTTPFATDILSYTSYGLVVNNEGIGYAQAHIMLFEGQTYYSTVRAKTGYNCHEEYIVSSSDGFTLDTTPPRIQFQIGERHVQSQDVVYQTIGDSVKIDWLVNDASGINETMLTKHIFEIKPETELVPDISKDPISLDSDPLSSGETFFSLMTVKDNADNEIIAMLPPVTADFTPPTIVDLNCTPVVSTVSSWLTCTWLAIQETESALKMVEVGLGSGRTFPNLLNMTSVPLHSQQWAFDVEDAVSSDITEFYVIMHIENAAGNRTEIVTKIINDVTPPLIDSLSIVTSPKHGFHSTEQKCQTTQDYIEVLVMGLEDGESDIQKVEIALGSSKGRSDIKSFHQYQLVNGLYTLGYLALGKGTAIFATIRVTNTVGLYTIAYSNGVIISPEPRLEVKDGPGNEDVDGQADVNMIQGSWSYSDPCPVLTVEWAIQELGGKQITNFTTIPDNGQSFYNDRLLLENFKTYVNFIRLTDALNRTFTAFSDGVTVTIQRPDTATVRDGLGNNDQDFQEAIDHLSANWDDFGNALSTLPSDHIIKYEAAVGTARESGTTRVDIHAFEDVGLATNVTFYGLNLTAKSVTYFVTVRAHSAAGSFVESSSDGIKVGYSADVTPGQVLADKYQSSNTSIRFSWTHFESDMVITHFYAGVSTRAPFLDNSTHDCQEYLQSESLQFDVYHLRVLEAESMSVIEGLKLTQGHIYYVTIIAEDEMGHCSAAVSNRVLVDVTPPEAGVIQVEGLNTESVIFLHNEQTIIIHLDDLSDPESYIQKADVQLLTSTACNPLQPSESYTVIKTLSAINESQIAIRNLELEHGKLYYLKVTVLNGAGLQTESFSKPIILDLSPPHPGIVKLGTDWTAMETSILNQTNAISGMIALKSTYSQAECITQRNILSPQFIKNWTSLSNNFASDCVGFENGLLHVIVQHDSFLTGVNRGAVQFSKLSWREGDYVFHMTPASGENILTGISLTSPSFLPPFLEQNGMLPNNQSSLPCDPEVELCMTDRNDTNVEGTLMSETDYGIGLTFIEENFKIKLLFWVQDRLQLKQSWISLDFDPRSEAANYSLNLKQRTENNALIWEVTVAVNSKEKGGFSGLVFPGEFIMSVYTWNIREYFPPVVDIFQPFSTSAKVGIIAVPVDKRPLCSYGSAFYDDVSGIKEILVGVSDDVNKTANISPFRRLKSFCIPCLLGCSTICSHCHGDSLSGDYTVLPLVIDRLSLDAANEVKANNSNVFNDSDISNSSSAADVFDDFQLPTYYLDVRVVSHSGLYSDVKSSNLIVDTSPPVINFVRCFDPEYSYDEPVIYLGNNHTVAASWDVSEDISSVELVSIYLGTQPAFDDIVPQIHLGLTYTNYTFENLYNKIQEGVTYYITVEARNEAGLVSMVWSNFTVHTVPPDMTAVSLTPENVTVKNVDGEDVALMESTKRLELNLAVDPSVFQQLDVEYFEWAIGTTDDKDDVFPRTRVGFKTTKKIAIVDGFMQLDNVPDVVSIGDYASMNYSSDTPPDPTANKFAMEPGRCLKQRFFGISRAYVASQMNPMPICIKRSNDIIVMGDNSSHTISKMGSAFALDGNWSSEFHIKLKLSKGAVMAGLLADADLDAEYGTSASTEFSPFIVRPDPINQKSSRWLRKRVFSMPGPNIFLTPIANAQFDNDVEVSFEVPTNVNVPPGGQVTLLFWNADAEMWQHPDEVCSRGSQRYNASARLIMARLCPEMFADLTSPMKQDTSKDNTTNSTRKRRSVSSSPAPPLWTLGPRMMTVSVIYTTSTNLPPSVQNASFTLMEDSGDFDFMITYADNEGDEVEFMLIQQPEHGNATVSPDGRVLYRPEADFSGTDVIYVKGKEILDSTSLANGMVPNVLNFSITVHVRAANDPPSIFYLPNENNSDAVQHLMVGPSAGNGVNMTVFIQSNTTTLAELGIVVFGDVDPNDTIIFMNKTIADPDAAFEVSDVSLQDPRLSTLNLTGVAGIGGKEIVLNLAMNYSGHVQYDTRVKDAANVFSLQLTLNVFILKNPCIHGHCLPRNSQDRCDDPKRAFTFDFYTCHCDLGYEAEWCQIESDECRTATCSPITDCVDLIGGYRCDVNPSKLAAIIVCSCGAVIIGIFVLFRCKKKSTKVSDSWKSTLSPEMEMKPKYTSDADDQRSLNDYDSRPGTSQTISDVHCSTTSETNEDFTFEKDSFFLFKPSQNPLNAHRIAVDNSAGYSVDMSDKDHLEGTKMRKFNKIYPSTVPTHVNFTIPRPTLKTKEQNGTENGVFTGPACTSPVQGHSRTSIPTTTRVADKPSLPKVED